MSTVEAIQVQLLGRDGIILWPGDPDDPPPYINDEELVEEGPRIFPFPNPHGPVFVYKLNIALLRWYLDDQIPPQDE